PRVCRPVDGPHGAPPVPQYVPPADAPPADAPPAYMIEIVAYEMTEMVASEMTEMVVYTPSS
ncbi:hypothetical protein A2U01_0071736, partial [Trifolium medium]|nr:hypothetical protein [Trifolium medium]